MITKTSTDADTVYEVVSALHENFDAYKDVTQTTKGWSIDEAQVEPTEVPFHEGLVRFLDEQGVWTEEAQEKNDELIERGEALRAGWEEYVEQADEISHEDWNSWKDENLSD